MKTFGNLKNRDLARMNGSVFHPWVAAGRAKEWLARVQQQFARLAPMGEDELRHFWLPVPQEGGSVHRWYDFCCYVVEGQPILRIIDRRGFLCEVDGCDIGQGRRLEDADFLKRTYNMVRECVDWIAENPAAFNEFVERNLPHRYRIGRIPRSTLNALAPEFRIRVADRAFTIGMLEKSLEESPQLLSTMTIRTFCRYYRVALEVFRRLPHDASVSDTDFYQRNHFCHIPEGADLDSEGDFRKFAFDHYGELGFSRINVCAWQPHGPGNGWCLHAATSYSAYVEDFLEVAAALYRTGVPLQIGDARKLLDIVEERDCVRIQPYTFHDYMNHHPEGTVLELPDPSECGFPGGVWTRDLLDRVVAAAEWEPLDEVKMKTEN